MKRLKRDPEREDRIYNEAIVDARPEEQAMSWYYYLESKVSFPFRARCVAANAVSPLRKGETVEVLRMAVEDACEHDLLVQIRWQGRKMAIPLSQLKAVDLDSSTDEATGEDDVSRQNALILERVVHRGRVYLSNATLRGKFYLRACLVNHRTTDEDVDAVIPEVLSAARELGW